MDWYVKSILMLKVFLAVSSWVAMTLASLRYLRLRNQKLRELFPGIKIRKILWVELLSEEIDYYSYEGTVLKEYCEKISKQMLPVFILAIIALLFVFLFPLKVNLY